MKTWISSKEPRPEIVVLRSSRSKPSGPRVKMPGGREFVKVGNWEIRE